MLGRHGTMDSSIMSTVRKDYRSMPAHFAAGDIVLDIGCHIGAFACLAAQRGATVVGYEASRENFELARINTAPFDNIRLHHAAVWRSDRPTDTVLFVPSLDTTNTGAGSVVFGAAHDAQQWSAARGEPPHTPPPVVGGPPLSMHRVTAIGLDDIIAGLGSVRLLKIDAEGAEFPILLTASRLAQVAMIVGEYHEFTEHERPWLHADAWVDSRPYTMATLADALTASGFVVESTSTYGAGRLGLFTAVRR